MGPEIIPRSFGTHNGSFHADEVTACGLLLLFDLIDRKEIYRTRDPEILNKCEYVCDVGGIYDPSNKRFDHHQTEYQGTMSSAGMILLYLKDRGVITSSLYDFFNRALILGVDAHDNGAVKLEIGFCNFSQVVSNFMPIEYNVSEEEVQKAFYHALDFVFGHLKRLQLRQLYLEKCEEKVKKVMIKSASCLYFDESMPWLEKFFENGGLNHPAKFLIMPAGNHWKLRGIPPSLEDRMRVRKPLPESWAGLHEDELRKVSGIDGAIFCHKGRFISIWETRKDAEKALHLALKED